MDVVFDDTGTKVLRISASALRAGTVADYMTPHLLGKGYFGRQRRRSDPFHHKARVCWVNMVSRCYDKSNIRYHRYGGKGVRVSDEWLSLSNFEAWYTQNWKTGSELDKDIFADGSNLYGVRTCVMIPKSLNTLLKGRRQDERTNKSNHIGVFCRPDGSYTAQCESRRNGLIVLGKYLKEEEAIAAYNSYKLDILQRMLQELTATGEISQDLAEQVTKRVVMRFDGFAFTSPTSINSKPVLLPRKL